MASASSSSLHAITSHAIISLSNPKLQNHSKLTRSIPHYRPKQIKQKQWVVLSSTVDEMDVIPVQSKDSTDQQGVDVVMMKAESEGESNNQVGVGGFATSEGQMIAFDGFGGTAATRTQRDVEFERFVDRVINAAIVLAAGTFAVTKLLTIDRDYWHGWTLYEILRYAPLHSWSAYNAALKTNPVFAKMVISGIVYSLGDWIAQCFEGKPLFEFDRARMFRSGLVGFALHGSLSHYYYQFCEDLFPFKSWWVVPAKVILDQTAWSAIWNSIYYSVVGVLRFDSPVSIINELKTTFWPMLTAGWKLWPFAHLITYGVVPVEQRLLWVDCIELIWVTILSTFSNEKTEGKMTPATVEVKSSSSLIEPPQELIEK